MTDSSVWMRRNRQRDEAICALLDNIQASVSDLLRIGMRSAIVDRSEPNLLEIGAVAKVTLVWPRLFCA